MNQVSQTAPTGKRDLLGNWLHCWQTWRGLRRYPGLFSLRDALQNWQAVLLPARLAFHAAGKALAREARIEPLSGGVNKVHVLDPGLVFYWVGPVDNNLHYSIDQEFNPSFPHHYTTPPVKLTPESLVLDVGACEGLFAFRVIRQKQAARVICFEPLPANVVFARRAAEENGVADKVIFEPVAVSKQSGQLKFTEGAATPDSSFLSADTSGAGTVVDCVSLDDYCASKSIRLGSRDLIKVDAEGSDLDVLLGAEKLIRNYAPQIAVTTYHKEEHTTQIVDFLKSVQPAYRMRLKGFASWTPKPRPVLLQASAA